MLKEFFSSFLQSNCPLCQRSTAEIICQNCQKQLKNCQLKNPCQFWQGELPVFVWGVYRDNLKRAIATFKYENCPQLGEVMGDWLANAWMNSSLGDRAKKLTVIPIPLHRKKLQARGFNQAELIAKSFCQLTGYRLQAKGLERVRDTQAMFGLSVLEREKNIQQAFCLGDGLKQSHPNLPVLLIDDIYTTGTTALAAANLLRSHKISVLGIGAIAISRKED
jgi:ComF family protein